jgi:ATP-dependent helicase/nuclease subunit B
LSSPPVFYNVDNLLPWLEEGVPLITPNHRLARHIKVAWGRHLLSLGKSTWETPAVYSLAQWWHHCGEALDPWGEHQAKILDAHQELELWLRCVTDTEQSSGLLRPRSAARVARDAYHNLQLWQVDWRNGADASAFRYTADGELFLVWAEKFEALCDDLGCVLEESLYLDWAQRFPQQHMVLVDFDDIPPLQDAALQQQAGNLERYQGLEQQAACYLQPCASTETELYAAADWARQHLARDPSARLGILLDDVASQRLRFERILREVLLGERAIIGELSVNFSSGTQLGAEPMVKTALQLLGLLRGDIQVEELVPLLHSRYRSTADATGDVQALQQLQKQGRAVLSNRDLRWHFREQVLGRELLALSQDRNLHKKCMPSVWVARFSSYLAQLGWPGTDALNSREYQIFEHWLDCLDSFANLDEVSGSLDLAAARNLLEQICLATTFQAQTPDCQLQVLGFLEAAGMNFDHLWVAGLGRNSFPASPSPNPFIPVALQKSLGFPHADSAREFQFAQRILHRFQHSAVSLTASYVAEEDAIVQHASGLVRDFELLEDAVPAQLPTLWRQGQQHKLSIEAADEQAPSVSEAEQGELRGGSGLIQDQSLCSFRGFVRQRLRVSPLPDLAVSLTAAERGSIMHNALNYLWAELGDSQALAARVDELDSIVGAACEAALADFNKAGGGDQVMLQLERQRLQKLLMQWLDIETERTQFEVISREEKIPVQIGALHINLRIDRIDRLANDELLVVDYKSGNAQIRYWLGERPQQPQLPLYVYALGDRCAGASFAIVRSQDGGYRGLAREDVGAGIKADVARATRGRVADWQVLVQGWQANLETLAQAFLDGVARVDPPDTNVSCTYCGLQAVCRISELQVGTDE